MKKNNWLFTVIFILVVFMLFMGLSRILTNKTSEYRKAEFFNAETDFDALFFGASRIREAVDPIYLWKNYGISSYNMASAGESIQMTYYVLAEALRKSTPKVVFIDSAKISDEPDSIDSGYGFVHESIDALPINKNKLEAIDYAGRFFDGGRLAFLSMMYAYHDRYEELDKDDFVMKPNYDKGAYIMTTVLGADKPVHLTDEAEDLKGGDGVRYYQRILDLCNSKGIKCVLVDIPVSKKMYSEGRQRKLNALIKMTRENGGETIAFNELIDEIGLDYDHCFGDRGHMNFLGSEKICDHLAGYMMDLGIRDHRDDPAYSISWNEDVIKWSDRKVEDLSERTDAVDYMFWAADDDHKITLYIKDMDDLYDQYAMDFCLEKLGIEPIEADEKILGGYDMNIEVRDKNGVFLAEQFFKYNFSSGLFTVE
ncbi:MAG: hypothetical protein IJT63_05150 [Lachnospiraceae bacterium]|nr:hypothetical protein [Lachnospiraceae bacterium]